MNSFFYECKHEISADYFTVEQNRNFSFPMHMHRCYEIILVLEGAMKIRIEMEEYSVGAGDLILIKPNRMHDLRTEGYSRHKLCIFSPELIAAISGRLTKYTLSSPIIRDLSEPYRALFSEISEEATLSGIKGVLYCLCDLYYRQLDLSLEDTASRNNHLIRNVLQYVENNMNQPCTLESVAENVGYSVSYLSRIFCATVGMPYKNYVRSVKINHACYLLENTEESITHIVSQCGFISVATFNHNFKDITGYSPTEYRRKHRG